MFWGSMLPISRRLERGSRMGGRDAVWRPLPSARSYRVLGLSDEKREDPMSQCRDCGAQFPSIWDWIMNLGNSEDALHQMRGEERAEKMLRQTADEERLPWNGQDHRE